MRIVESVSVPIACEEGCLTAGNVVIVSTVERGDVVLYPIGWEVMYTPEVAVVSARCPKHKEEEKG